ncbi:MAG: site-specific DNA-methyltransferase [bacterium]|nr:site-specific DNA-methyltransferase [bacterium]
MSRTLAGTIRGSDAPCERAAPNLPASRSCPTGRHTAVMPEGLAEFFAKAACPPGGVVVDPFAGSGTTMVVARRHGRQAGGIELLEEYVSVATERLAGDYVQEELGLLRVAI